MRQLDGDEDDDHQENVDDDDGDEDKRKKDGRVGEQTGGPIILISKSWLRKWSIWGVEAVASPRIHVHTWDFPPPHLRTLVFGGEATASTPKIDDFRCLLLEL